MGRDHHLACLGRINRGTGDGELPGLREDIFDLPPAYVHLLGGVGCGSLLLGSQDRNQPRRRAHDPVVHIRQVEPARARTVS